VAEVCKTREGRGEKLQSGIFLFKPLVTQEGRNNQCKDRTHIRNEAFSETKWTFERACKCPAGLLNLPTLKNVYQDNKTKPTLRWQTKRKTEQGYKSLCEPGQKPASNGKVRKKIPIYSKVIRCLSTPGILTIFPEALVLAILGMRKMAQT